MKNLIIFLILAFVTSNLKAQQHLDQNGLKTSVTDILATGSAGEPMRYEIAVLGYNSYHWQNGGIIIIELFSQYYNTGYEKYILNVGSGTGINSGEPELLLLESAGSSHLAKITLGNAYNLTSSFGGYTNKALPVYLDLRQYGKYRAKITYQQDKVEVVGWLNQLKVNIAPTGTSTSDFSVPTKLDNPIISTKNLMIEGAGTHYFANGNLGIGTTMPKERLSVNGKIRAHEIKVETANWPDYVFEDDYKLMSLAELEKYIKTNKHLPEIPTAIEVKQNGIELGEMNRLLLKKIEELTLHLIDMGNENKNLKKTIELNKDLEQRVASTEKQLAELKLIFTEKNKL